MDRLYEVMKRQAAGITNGIGQNKVGVVQSYNPANHTCRVMYQPEGVLSAWLPVVSPMVGPGWGIVVPAVPGQQVVVACAEGDINNGMVVGAMYSSQAVPPMPAAAIGGSGTAVTPGEVALVHQSGAIIRLCADGSIFLNAGVINAQATTMNAMATTINATATDYNVTATTTTIMSTVIIDGSLTVTEGMIATGGEVSDQHGSLDRLRGNHNIHTHLDSRDGDTTAPITGIDPE